MRLRGSIGYLFVLSLLVCPAAADPLKVAFVYVSPIADAGWTYAHDQARLALQTELGGAIETTYVENVAEGADAERVIHSLAARGYGMIFTTSFGYMNPTLKVARKFPKVTFEHATGYKLAPNVGTYQSREYQARYLNGIVAGAMSKSNVLGYVASFPIPEVLRGIDSFALGMREANPKARLKVVWVNTWHDPAREREATDALALQGVDVVTHHTDSVAVVQAAEARGIYSVGYNTDMAAYAPKGHLTSTVHNWLPLYRDMVKAKLAGTWTSQALWPGLAEGISVAAPLNPVVPDAVRETARVAEEELRTGRRLVFQGPIHDQAGTLRVPAGKHLSDEELLALDWYVEGVEGQMPE